MLENYNGNPCVATMMSLRQEAFKYLEEPLPEKSTWLALASPYMGMADFDWFLKQIEPLDVYIELNRQLYDSLLDFNLYNVKIPKNIPITYISGSLDYACPVQTIDDVNMVGLVDILRYGFGDRQIFISTHEQSFEWFLRYRYSKAGKNVKIFNMKDIMLQEE